MSRQHKLFIYTGMTHMNMIKPWLAASLLALSAAAHADVTLGQNLIVNGDAESSVSGWLTFDGYDLFQAVDYGDNWVKPSQPGPVDRGSKLFAGVGAQSAGYQTLSLGDLGTGTYSYTLDGWLGGWASQGDNALLYVSFLDITDNEIGHAEIGPVTPADRNNSTGLLYRQSTGLLPVGTAKIMFSLSMERQGGGDNDGYADNLSFVLQTSAVPEPQSAVLTLVGLALMGGVLARRRQVS
jgi:hypothetical protein